MYLYIANANAKLFLFIKAQGENMHARDSTEVLHEQVIFLYYAGKIAR